MKPYEKLAAELGVDVDRMERALADADVAVVHLAIILYLGVAADKAVAAGLLPAYAAIREPDWPEWAS